MTETTDSSVLPLGDKFYLLVLKDDVIDLHVIFM